MDGGKLYVSNHINQLFTNHNIKHIVTDPYHPESNGAVEIIIGTLKNSLRKTYSEIENLWKRALYIAVTAYRMFPHRTTGYSPFKIIYRREAIWTE